MKAQTIELSRAEVQLLVDHCEKHNLKTWFVGKNEGAYVGASAGAEEQQQCLFYFKGCNPKKDANWYDSAHAKFGGDDFHDQMDVQTLKNALADEKLTAMEVKVTKSRISIIHIQ
jgi:hypothetical protein